MTDTSSLPLYRVVTPCFLEPFHFMDNNPAGNSVGATIEWEGPPGPHLEPLNAEARERFEEWYDQAYPAKDEKGKVIPGQFEYPHQKYRTVEYSPGERNPVRIMEAAPRNDPGENPLSLAQLQLRQMPDTDQRPGPRLKAAAPPSGKPPIKVT